MRTVALVSRHKELATALQVDHVLLIGGSSGVPLISRRIQEVLQLQSKEWHMRHVAVALGAAYYANLLWGEKLGAGAPAGAAPRPTAASRKLGIQRTLGMQFAGFSAESSTSDTRGSLLPPGGCPFFLR